MSDRKIKKVTACLAMSFVLAATCFAAAAPAQETGQNEQQAVVQENAGQEETGEKLPRRRKCRKTCLTSRRETGMCLQRTEKCR